MSEQAQEKMAQHVEAMHKLMDGMGVSHSVYGQAAREGYIRQQLGSPVSVHTDPPCAACRENRMGPFAPDTAAANARIAFLGVTPVRRTVFTREEVLAAIRARAAMIDVSAGTDAAFAAQLGVLADLLRMFERME